MSSFYRSDSVNYYKIVLPRESAWEIMNILGQKKLIHIVPNNVAILNKPFFSQVKRCDEALLKVHNLQILLRDQNIYKPRSSFSNDAFEEIYRMWEESYSQSKTHSVSMLNDIISEVDHAWDYYQDLTKRADVLKAKMQFYKENTAIIRAGEANFGRSFFTHNEQRVNELGHVFLNTNSKINFKCGIIDVEEEIRFKKTIFRITKGNSVVVVAHFSHIFQTPLEENQKLKAVFFVLFPGKSDSYFEKKLSRLVENFCSNEYELPTRESEFEHVLNKTKGAYQQTRKLYELTGDELKNYLSKFTEHMERSNFFRRHQYLKLYLIKEKELYMNLNEMELFNNFLQGEIYVRHDDIEDLQKSLTNIEETLRLPAGQLIPATAHRFPTYFVRNDYTRSAQEIVETYGVPKYKEANPSFFTTITFPFLFGVMFGDICHGLILFSFGLFLIFKKDTIQNQILKMVLPHRYLFALMGFFATYCGFIYNDYLSISLNIFGSCYMVDGIAATEAIPRMDDCVYPVGLDPVWSISSNYLNFVNSLKMKISVIIAVVHMTLGVLVKAGNSLYFKKYMDFFVEFIPQLLFMLLLFGYMDFLIIYKWTVDWPLYYSAAPSIITTMINMPLKMGKTMDCCGGQPLWGTYGDTSQDGIQEAFVIIAIIAIPVMLLPKPLYQIYCVNKQYKKISEDKGRQDNQAKVLLQSESLDNVDLCKRIHRCLFPGKSSEVSAHDEEHGADQIFVHQLIETIEYVLGCISNTASYLRLWALSLAHSELSEVFFEKLVEGSIVSGYSGIPMMLIGFIFLAGITFGILLCMDSMECFLHTLRLHWVEFQNKFYKGDGFAFKFYSFTDKILSEVQIYA